MRARTGFHRHRARRLRRHEPPSTAAPCSWNTFFARLMPMMVTSSMDAVSRPVLCFDITSLAHCDAVGGARHPPIFLGRPKFARPYPRASPAARRCLARRKNEVAFGFRLPNYFPLVARAHGPPGSNEGRTGSPFVRIERDKGFGDRHALPRCELTEAGREDVVGASTGPPVWWPRFPQSWMIPASRLITPSSSSALRTMAFAKLKALLRKAVERTVDSLWNTIGRLVDVFTPQECSNYFAAAGYDAD